MLGKIGTSVVLATALFLGAVRLPAAPCILTNAPTEKACTMGCCKYKSCCETSDKRTGSPVQPLAKAGSDQQNIASLPAIVAPVISRNIAQELFAFSSAEHAAHSPAPLALNCIRLI
jgi:hypothetical protein